jgi:hypothetical protein
MTAVLAVVASGLSAHGRQPDDEHGPACKTELRSTSITLRGVHAKLLVHHQ